MWGAGYEWGYNVIGGTVTHGTRSVDVIKVRQQLFGVKGGFGVGSSWVAHLRTSPLFDVTATAVNFK